MSAETLFDDLVRRLNKIEARLNSPYRVGTSKSIARDIAEVRTGVVALNGLMNEIESAPSITPRFRLAAPKRGYPGLHIEDTDNPAVSIYIPETEGAAELAKRVLAALNGGEVGP